MKIAIVGPFPPYRGGIAQFSSRLLDALSSGFPENEFIPVSYRRLYPSLLFPGTSQIEPFESQHVPESLRLLDSCNPFNWISTRKYFNKHSFDRIIIQWWHPFFAPALLVSIPKNVKCAAICHNIAPHESFPFAGFLAHRFLRRINLAVVHSNADLKEAEAISIGFDLLKLYHPIYDQYQNQEMDRTIARAYLGYPENTRLVLFFGLIRPYKGLQDLIEAMKLLPMDISLLIVGECYSDQNEILDEISSAQLSGRVKWVDKFVPDCDVSIYFNAADLVALPYRHATQSGVAQIALAFGKILVLSNTGGLSELVDIGSTGFLSEPCSPSSISESILAGLDLSSDSDLAHRIRRKASSFSWETYASSLMEHLK